MIDKYIKMLVYKLREKVKFTTLYMIKYEGQWERYNTKRELLNRLIEIEKKG